jgi:hypothetical protein
MKKTLILLLLLAVKSHAEELVEGWTLESENKPSQEAEFLGGPHIDTVINVYSREDKDSSFGKKYKIVLSSLSNPNKKELLFKYERAATATLSPDGKWIVINDRPFRGECKPRLYKQESGLKYNEVTNPNIRSNAIKYFIECNKYPNKIRDHLLPEGKCFVESLWWSDDSKALLLRLSKGQTGEPIWIDDWYCVYKIEDGKVSQDLNILNGGGIRNGKYLVPNK